MQEHIQLQRTVIDQLRTYPLQECAKSLIDSMIKFDEHMQRVANINSIKTDNEYLKKEDVIKIIEKIDEYIRVGEKIKNGNAALLYNEEIENFIFRIEQLQNIDKKTPLIEEINNGLNEVACLIKYIDELIDKFIEEMRHNALTFPKGRRSNAYAVDCCNFLDSYVNSQVFLLNGVEYFINKTDKQALSWTKELLKLSVCSGLNVACNSVEEYFPNTFTVKRESTKWREVYWEIRAKMSDDEFFEYIAQIDQNGVLPTEKNIEIPKPKIKLHWNGTADSLYDIFRQLKNHHLPSGKALIENSYDEIALVIQDIFAGFDNVKHSTIRGRLTKSTRPQKSFNIIDIDFTELD